MSLASDVAALEGRTVASAWTTSEGWIVLEFEGDPPTRLAVAWSAAKVEDVVEGGVGLEGEPVESE